MTAVAIMWTDMGAAQLRAEAGRARSPAVVRRLLALAPVLDGIDRQTAARNAGMDRQTLRDWVHRYNAEGVAGLSSRKAAGRKPTLDAAQMAAFRQIVETGPDLAIDKAVRWPQARARGAVQGRRPRAHGRQVPECSGLSPPVGAPAASGVRSGGAGGL